MSGTLLIHQGLIASPCVAIQPVAALAGAFLIVGFWTPVAGVVVLACELCARQSGFSGGVAFHPERV